MSVGQCKIICANGCWGFGVYKLGFVYFNTIKIIFNGVGCATILHNNKLCVKCLEGL